MLCVDVYFNTNQPFSPLAEVVYYSKEFLMMDCLLSLCNGEGFCMILDWIKLFASIDDIVLRQDANNCWITSIGIYNGLKSSIQLGKDGS